MLLHTCFLVHCDQKQRVRITLHFGNSEIYADFRGSPCFYQTVYQILEEGTGTLSAKCAIQEVQKEK